MMLELLVAGRMLLLSSQPGERLIIPFPSSIVGESAPSAPLDAFLQFSLLNDSALVDRAVDAARRTFSKGTPRDRYGDTFPDTELESFDAAPLINLIAAETGRRLPITIRNIDPGMRGLAWAIRTLPLSGDYAEPEIMAISYRSGMAFSLQGSLLGFRFKIAGYSRSLGDLYYIYGEWRDYGVGRVFFGRGLRIPYLHVGSEFLGAKRHYLLRPDALTTRERTAVRLFGGVETALPVKTYASRSPNRLFADLFAEAKRVFEEKLSHGDFTRDEPIAIEFTPEISARFKRRNPVESPLAQEPSRFDWEPRATTANGNDAQ